MSYEVEINGVTYESRSELNLYSCNGCVVENNICGDLCNQLDTPVHPCHGVIWIKKEKSMGTTEQTNEPKYTVKEVLEAVEQVTDEYFTDHQKKQIIDILTRKNNPEYKLYLELKEKFGE